MLLSVDNLPPQKLSAFPRVTTEVPEPFPIVGVVSRPPGEYNRDIAHFPLREHPLVEFVMHIDHIHVGRDRFFGKLVRPLDAVV